MYGTYGEIYEQFISEAGISEDMIIDWRPASSFYTDLGVNIRRAIIVDIWADRSKRKPGGRIIYTPDKEFKVEK